MGAAAHAWIDGLADYALLTVAADGSTAITSGWPIAEHPEFAVS